MTDTPSLVSQQYTASAATTPPIPSLIEGVTTKTALPPKLVPMAKASTATTTTTSTLIDAPSSSSSSSSPITLSTTSFPTAATETISIASILHKKDSGTSITATVLEPSSNATMTPDGTTNDATIRRPDLPISPAGRVLTRPLSTSVLSSQPLLASPHIIPTPQRYAGFNLATLGQLSPSVSTTMTMSRADSLAYQASYFAQGISGEGSGHRTAESLFAHTAEASGGGGGGLAVRSTTTGTTMCGSDAISLLDLDDAHDDLVMIDSNGNSSGGGVAGSAVVGETMASASAIVSTHQHPYHLGAHHPHHPEGGNSYAPSVAASTSSGGAVGALASINQGHGASSSAFSTTSPSVQPRSSIPSLASQAKLDAMQRVAMIAAIQQNGGAKVLATHRVGRRQDRPSRNIRFSDFHRICEIEYEFELGKPLIANGRALVHSTCVQRVDGDEKRDEMLYLFSDVLVTGTKIKPLAPSKKPHPSVKIEVTPDQEMESADEGSTSESASDESAASSDHSDHEHEDREDEQDKTEKEKEREEQDQVDYRAKNPYAGHLENQRISRLTQVQADIVEDSDEPLLTITAPQLHARLLFESSAKRDKFITLLNDTTVAHKHHLLFQSKYLADLKKFKRHSAFSFDTSFLKTWGIPGGLHLGSVKHGSGPGVGYPMASSSGGHGTLTSSPLASPGAFDPYQYQQHLNRPQSMAGSLFSFAMSGGSFPSFSDHSKESSYATLKGSNATNALQYHHQQQQMLQHQLQVQANRLSNASIAPHRPGIDRSSTGSTFDPIWFLKGAQDTVRSVSRKTENSEGPSSGANSIVDEPVDSDHGASSGDLHTPISGSNVSGLLSSANRLSTSSFSILPSSSSSSSLQHLGTLRNGAGWVRDEDASVCMVCTTTKFGVLVRKHHCRLCGRVICWKCCQMKDASLLDPPTSPTKDEGENADTSSTSRPEQGGLSIQTLRKPIRVCLDCIEHENLHGPSSPQSQGPSPTMSSFPLQGVLGKLMPSSSPQLMTSATTATGSTFSASHPFASTKQMLSSSSSSSPAPYPRKMNRANNRPPHHRASLYRIDVECVGEEDEEEEEGQTKEHGAGSETSAQPSKTKNEEEDQDMATLLQLKDDLLLEDHDEEDVNSQIMTLESEVESMLLQNAAVPLMFGARSSHTGRIGGRRTGYRIPSEVLATAAVQAGLRKEVIQDEDEEEEEKSIEELLAQQDAQLQSLMM
ncbi:hypothetical protein MVEG_05049 [Podila verticillata NRRL 6337]|nr:hypothetical protein MVEG_05049 [Podila verticillata NRRL 6337]